MRERPTLLILAILMLLASGCSSYRPPVPAPRSGPPSSIAPPQHPITTPAAAQQAVELARSLLRTPYRLGGESHSGIDCSGLTSYVFQRLGIQLPRRAIDQSTVGHWTAPDELRAGDLVFFGQVRDKPFHVGLVVSEAGQPLRMIHSATSQGVVETDVTGSAYWMRRFKFGRRILPPS